MPSSNVNIAGYRIERLIADGGMASVYKAVQTSLGRYVALKVLRKFDNLTQAQRFLKEGHIIAALNHRNIITIYDIGFASGRPYLSMEFLEGGDLEQRIAQGMTPDQALAVLEGIGNCLDFVHQHGIVHRDIKPANILFHDDDTPILTDFGIAKELQVDSSLTLDHLALGSPFYLSPEQARRKPLDGRADIYSLGIIFYQMLTGEKPFVEESYIDTIMAHIMEPMPRLPRELSGYQSLLDRMTAKDPKHRFASASEMVARVRELRRSPSKTNRLLPQDILSKATAGLPIKSSLSKSFNALHRQWQRWTRPAHAETEKTTEARNSSLGYSLDSARKLLNLFNPTEKKNRKRLLVSGSLTLGLAIAITAAALIRTAVEQPIRANAESHTGTATTAQADGTNKADGASAQASQEMTTAPATETDTTGTADTIPDEQPIAATDTTEAPQPTASPETDKPAPTVIAHTATAPSNTPLVPTVPQTPHSDTLIKKYLALANKAVREYRLTLPPGDSALDYYREVLNLEPRNPDALAGLTHIADRYATLAEKELKSAKHDKAETFVKRGLAIEPQHKGLLALKIRIESAKGLAEAKTTTPPPTRTQPPTAKKAHIEPQEQTEEANPLVEGWKSLMETLKQPPNKSVEEAR